MKVKVKEDAESIYNSTKNYYANTADCLIGGDGHFYAFDGKNYIKVKDSKLQHKYRKHPVEREELIKLHHDELTQLNYISTDVRNISHISNPKESVQLKVIEKRPDLFFLIKNPTLKVCDLAVSLDKNNIIYVDPLKFPLIYEKYQFNTF